MRKGKFVSAIIAAAGQGKRMNNDINKQYLILIDKPVLAHTLEVFEQCNEIDEIIVVVHPHEVQYCIERVVNAFAFQKIKKVVMGGKERQESIWNGLRQISSTCDIVVIHDGARPLVRMQHIIDSIDAAIQYKAVGVGVPVKDTIKRLDEDNHIICTPDRSKLWAIQTPQTFDYQLLMEGHVQAAKDGFFGTDDTVLVERIGWKAKMIVGSYDNIKITTPEDLYLAEAILKYRGYK